MYCDDKEVPFALCLQCQTVVTFKKSDGTAGLRRHNCKSATPTPQRQLSMVKFLGQKQLPSSALQQISDQAVKFVAKDIRPFSVTSGDGFLSFAQTLIDIGATHGKFDIREVLKHRTTL